MDVTASQVDLGTDALPAHWRIGDFDLMVDAQSVRGKHDRKQHRVTGVSGRGWVAVPGARPHALVPSVAASERPSANIPAFVQAVEVVDEVRYPATQIPLAQARSLNPDAQTGQTISLHVGADRTQLRDIVDLGRGIAGWLDTDPPAGRIPVDFADLTVELGGMASVVAGSVTSPILGPLFGPIEIDIAGFTLLISRFTIAALKGGSATASVRLPAGVTDAASCRRVEIDLGRIPLSPTGDYFVTAPDREFGPWLVGDTGLILSGTGFVLDLSLTHSDPALPTAWRGLMLRTGTTTGAENIPEPCNSGYLRGDYAFADATVVASGFWGRLELTAPVSFTALNPLGQPFSFRSGWLAVGQSRILGGELDDGVTDLLPTAICGSTAGDVVRVDLPAVSVQPDLDLSATLQHGGQRISWGELTRRGDELVVWGASADLAYLYLPAGAVASYSPAASGTFVSPSLGTIPTGSLSELAAHGVAGVTFVNVQDVAVASPDRPGGTANLLKLGQAYGWLRSGIAGVDGALLRYSAQLIEQLGDPAGTGYVGVKPFDVALFGKDRINLLAEFATSASFDSHFGGSFDIPKPAQLDDLVFTEMKLTSTACLVGGDITLPAGGIPLGHWDVDLVPIGSPTQAGVLSVRTGRVLFTAAGIAEPKHFARPFGLTWGEVLADGQVGELFLDFNDWGQRFDGLVFHPHEIVLSPEVVTAPYLGVWGTVLLPFFGLHEINVHDGVKDASHTGFPRWVTVSPGPITPHAPPTDLKLSGVWRDATGGVIADVECASADFGYHEAIQEGFFGTGTAAIGSLGSDELAATVEIHSDATDIRFTSETAHDLTVSAIAQVGSLAQIAGDLRVEGLTVQRMTMFGMLAASASTGGLMGPKAGYDVEVNTVVTATSFDFYASGDLLLAVGATQVEASATAHLFFDYAAHTAEGELFGHIDCDAVFSGLSGDGQLTWFVGPTMGYLQGMLKVTVFSLVGGASLEGGLFIGSDVPNALAWVLDTSDPHFSMSRALLPATITGVYGYGRASFGVQYYVLSGGIDIFAGVGAFADPPGQGAIAAPFGGSAQLPYVVGACGIGVHGEILGGLVSASAWANLSVRGPVPTYFEGRFGLRGCVAWVLCASVDITGRYSSSGFELF